MNEWGKGENKETIRWVALYCWTLSASGESEHTVYRKQEMKSKRVVATAWPFTTAHWRHCQKVKHFGSLWQAAFNQKVTSTTEHYRKLLDTVDSLKSQYFCIYNCFLFLKNQNACFLLSSSPKNLSLQYYQYEWLMSTNKNANCCLLHQLFYLMKMHQFRLRQ